MRSLGVKAGYVTSPFQSVAHALYAIDENSGDGGLQSRPTKVTVTNCELYGTIFAEGGDGSGPYLTLEIINNEFPVGSVWVGRNITLLVSDNIFGFGNIQITNNEGPPCVVANNFINAGQISVGLYQNGIELELASYNHIYGNTIQQGAPGYYGININDSSCTGNFLHGNFAGIRDNGTNTYSYGNSDGIFAVSGGQIGFFGTGPTTQPATPTTLAEVISALQALGLVG
jgi:hypothetical protein